VHTKTNVGAFPVGASVDLLELSRDPYPIYGLLQAREPISWIEALGMWYVTRYEDVRAILMDSDNFTTACEKSLIFDTFGSQMLTTEGAEHERYRRAVQPHFSLGFIRKNLESAIEVSARALVAGFKDKGLIELRACPFKSFCGYLACPSNRSRACEPGMTASSERWRISPGRTRFVVKRASTALDATSIWHRSWPRRRRMEKLNLSSAP
jgi:hypothetical protein